MEKDNETSDNMKEIMAEEVTAENEEFQKLVEIAHEPIPRHKPEKELSNEKVEELSKKVDALHKGFIEGMREAQLETSDLEITYVSDTAVDEEPESDDLLPVDTVLMQKCITEARWLVLGTRDALANAHDYHPTQVSK